MAASRRQIAQAPIVHPLFMRVIVTCGPSYEPIDEVRRITNFSTGELGLRLAHQLVTDGHEVICFRGETTTWRDPEVVVTTTPFSTNDDLHAQLEKEAATGDVGAVFHAAALADFAVGVKAARRKISSTKGPLKLTLVPAAKLIRKLRGLFPAAKIVGWKYELEGSRHEAIAQAREQIVENDTDACVANGQAYGEGFGFVAKDGTVTHVPTKEALAKWIGEWLRRTSGERFE
jgi:phosphopantothenoylcysteine synthetase/decarboxylase